MNIVDICLLVVILLIAFYVLTCHTVKRKRVHRRRKYRHLYQVSNGAYDESARQALDTIRQIDTPTAEDEFTAGAIVELNKNNGDMRRATVADGEEVLRRYRATLMDLFEHPEQERDINPLFMVDYIGGFIERNERDLQAWPDGGQFMQVYAQTAPDIRGDNIEQRRVEAAQAASNRIEFVDEFLKHSKTHTNDPQNVHDSAVNNSLRRTMERLRGTTVAKPPRACIDEARDFIESSDLSPGRKARALRALDSISIGSFNSTIGSTDTDVFSVVWSRADEHANAAKSKLMREAVVESLADFYDPLKDENGQSLRDTSGEIQYNQNPVCVNGRCGRMLESLVLLDHDDQVGGAQTLEQHKNDIMESVKSALHREIEAAKTSDDEDLRNLAKSYEDPNVTVKPEVETQFRETVKKEIDVIVDAKKEVIGETAAATIKQEAYAAIA